MRRSWSLAAALALVLALALASSAFGAAACSSSSSSPVAEAGSSSGDPVPNAGGPEGGGPGGGDGGLTDGPAQDSPSGDGAPKGNGDILGTLTSGVCGTITSQLTSTTPALDINVLVFVAGETYDRASLSPGGQRLFDTANAGGSSTESEAMSYEVLRYCEGATLLHTETEIAYQPPDDSGANTITDLEVEMSGKKVGVSVTRAYRPSTQPLTDADVKALLEKKLEGVNRSSQRVLPADKWVKQILHVFSVNKSATDAIGRVWPSIDPAIRADTIVLVTQTAGGGFVYCNPDPPLGSECP